MQRFDEVELEPVPLGEEGLSPAAVPETGDASRWRRLLALLTDISLFVALVLALSPLLPAQPQTIHLTALAGFVVVLSYYYFVGSWMLWGKTIGGVIFDVRIVGEENPSMSLRSASLRWLGVYASLLLAGLGFALAALPSRLSLPDRISGTRCMAA